MVPPEGLRRLGGRGELPALGPQQLPDLLDASLRVCVYMYVCMYVCMHVCMYACMYVRSHFGSSPFGSSLLAQAVPLVNPSWAYPVVRLGSTRCSFSSRGVPMGSRRPVFFQQRPAPGPASGRELPAWTAECRHPGGCECNPTASDFAARNSWRI